MEISEAQYPSNPHCVPRQRDNVSLFGTQPDPIKAMEHGYTWRGRFRRFGNCHTIYTRLNR